MTRTAITPDEVLAETVARLGGRPPASAELRELAGWLRAAATGMDLPTGPAPRGSRIVLAARPGGPVLAIADFPAGDVTDIHGHGSWGIGVLLAGADQYERWEPAGAGAARLLEVRELGAGDVLFFGGPPHDVHRQCGIGSGARELLLFGTDPRPARRVGYRPATGLADRIVDALYRADPAALQGCYAPDALLDVNVPHWRYQLTGRAAIGAALAEELDIPARRCTGLRRTDTAEGILVETEVRFAVNRGEGLWRGLHQVRLGGGSITEHVIYGTGRWDPEMITRQAAEAPMVRP